jgi:site-specific DNA-cytosine methylase
MARVLIACEFSGIVRDAFIARGHDAVSVDLEPSERPGPHRVQDVLQVAYGPLRWDAMIAFPPCTALAASGARHWPAKRADGRQAAAIEFVRSLMAAQIDHIAIENPVGILSTVIRKPDQIVQPWQFGHGETKATCLWLQNLPALTPTDIVDGRKPRVHHASPSPDRWKVRSRTLQGIADAMADQWGRVL